MEQNNLPSWIFAKDFTRFEWTPIQKTLLLLEPAMVLISIELCLLEYLMDLVTSKDL